MMSVLTFMLREGNKDDLRPTDSSAGGIGS